MGLAIRASDGRRAKWKSFQSNANQEEGLISRLQREIDERPPSRYKLDERVLTPALGYRGITNKYYRASTGWHYTFYTQSGLYTYKEKELLAQGDYLLLKDVMSLIAANG